MEFDTCKIPCIYSITYIFIHFQYKIPSADDMSLQQTKAEAMTEFYDVIMQSLDALKLWADKIPGFTDLCKEDQELLFQSAVLELFALRIAFRCVFCYIISVMIIRKLILCYNLNLDMK